MKTKLLKSLRKDLRIIKEDSIYKFQVFDTSYSINKCWSTKVTHPLLREVMSSYFYKLESKFKEYKRAHGIGYSQILP